jgi:zinc protease
MKKNFKLLLCFGLVALFTACSTSSKLDRSQVPTPGPAPVIQLGESQTFTLENGLKVIVVENHKLPRVSYRISLDLDPIIEGSKAGYVSTAGSLLRTGTTTKSKAEIDEAVDFLGANLSTSASSVSGSSLKKHSDKLLELMSDVLLNPSFSQEELDKSRKQQISSLVSSKTDPNAISGNIQGAAKYGLDHPYGEQITEETIENITRQDLVNYYNTYFKANAAYLVIVGDITPEEAKANAEKHFGKWKSGDVPTQTFSNPLPPTGNKVVFVPLDGAVQSVISVTHPIDYKPGSSDAAAASVMNSILGGGVFSGRLMQNLREDKAFTYGARSSLSSDEYIGSFSAGASVRNEVTDSSIVEILFELNRLTTELVADSTLEFVKNSMNGNFARSLESPQTIARFALNIKRYNLPEDYYATYLERLSQVTKEDVLAAAKKYIKPNNLYITVVGNKDEVADKLSGFAASGEVDFFDSYGNVWEDLRKAPEGITAQSVVDAHITARGGVENMSKVTSYIRSGTMGMQGMALDMKIQMKGNSKYKMEAFMGGSPVMTQVYDGVKGANAQMGMSNPMADDELAGMKEQADFMYEAKLSEYGVTLDLKGIKDIDGKDCYAVTLTDAAGDQTTEYYDVESGLKYMTVQSEDTPTGPMVATTTVLEYMEVDGVLFPKMMKQAVGPQAFDITLDKIEVNAKIKDNEFKVD